MADLDHSTDVHEALAKAAEDVSTHVDSWISLLTAHVSSLPEDIAPDGGDKSYARHELAAMSRDLPALVAALEAVRGAQPSGLQP